MSKAIKFGIVIHCLYLYKNGIKILSFHVNIKKKPGKSRLILKIGKKNKRVENQSIYLPFLSKFGQQMRNDDAIKCYEKI